MISNCGTGNGNPFTVQIVQSSAKTFFARLFYANTGEPFDLTGVTEIVALLPGSSGSPVKKTYSSSGGITVVGSPGAGKIQIALLTTDTEFLLANSQIAQNLQIIVTLAGVAQINTLSYGSPPVSGSIASVVINGQTFSYIVKSNDSAEDVFVALSALITNADILVTGDVSSSDDMAELALTSVVAALGFTISVSAAITQVASTANGGTRTVFLLQQVLNIQPQDYTGS